MVGPLKNRDGAAPAGPAGDGTARPDAKAGPFPSSPGGRSTTWRRFASNRTALAGLAAAAGLYAVAALAPFLAGDRPILFIGSKGIESPLFRAFTREDFLWFASFAAALCTGAAAFLGRRLGSGRRAAARGRRAALLVAILSLAVITAAGAAWPERLVHEDYRAYRDGSKEAALCIFPLVPYSPSEVPLEGALEPPGAKHWFGTDRDGDDVLARMIHGTRISLIVGIVAVAVCLLLGIPLGAFAGYFGGMTDALVCRLIEVVTCFPAFFAVLAVLAFLPPRIYWVMLLIGLVRWPHVARLTRGEFFKIRGMEFVTAARALGLSNGSIIFRQILPNALAPVIVAASFAMAGAVLIESGLSFLGIGPASCQSWGRLLSEFRPYFDVAWWLSVFPGAGIFVTVTAFNLVGEGLRDALDPRLRE